MSKGKITDLKEELIELLTIQIALDDKLHKYREILTKLAIRLTKLESDIKE